MKWISIDRYFLTIKTIVMSNETITKIKENAVMIVGTLLFFGVVAVISVLAL
jgi:hypothetical protein